MNLNPFSKPPLSKIFNSGNNGEPAPTTHETPHDVPAHAIEHKSASLFAWKKLLTFFLAGTLSIQAVEAASMSMNAEEKKDAVEYMKSSPDIVKAYESKLLEMAKDKPSEDMGIFDGQHLTKKVFNLDNNSAAYIEYLGEDPISINVRETDSLGSKIIVSDGHLNDITGIRQKIDGYVDQITIRNSDGTMSSKISFIETTNNQGDVTLQIIGAKGLSEGGSSMMYVNAQRVLQSSLENGVE